jgi:hypothetical protein
MFTPNTYHTGFFTVNDEKHHRIRKAIAYLHGTFKASTHTSVSSYNFIVLGETDKAYHIALIIYTVGCDLFVQKIHNHERYILSQTYNWVPKAWLNLSECTMNAWVDMPMDDLPTYWMELAP